MNRLFGTDGVRGVANAELTPELAFNLGKAGGYILGRSHANPRVIIGKDTRISGDMLEHAISAGIMAMGGEVLQAGVLPTPAIACLVRKMDAEAGIMISASHNPYEYNGIKFFNREGFKLDDELEDAIEDIIVRDIDVNSHITGARLGRSRRVEEEALALYSADLIDSFEGSLLGVRIVLDCANGSAAAVAPGVFHALGAEVIAIGDQPDGVNINDKCGSTHPGNLQERVVSEGAFMGMAYDGDADRLIAVDEKGRIIDGDKLLAISAGMLLRQGKLPDNRVTATVMSNMGFLKHMEQMGCTVDLTAVGDRYVLESMRRTGGILGGEQSGHMIFLEHATTGDGILSSLQVLRAVLSSGRMPSELSDEIPIYPQVLRNSMVQNENKGKYLKDAEVLHEIDLIEEELRDAGRVLIRPSGTEPLVRVMLEGKDQQRISEIADHLAQLIASKFGEGDIR